MTAAEADALFAQLENESGDEFERVSLPDGFDAGKVQTVYPGKLPGNLVRIYDTVTGYSTDVLPYMLKAVMQMKNNQGGLRFSRRQMVTPPSGTSWCFLHANFPDASRVRQAGIVERCSKPVPLLSVVHAEHHAEVRHSGAWKVYQKFLSEEREAEHREFQRLQMEVMRRQLATMPGTMLVDENGPETPMPGYSMPEGIVVCGVGECARFFDNEHAALIHRGKDHKGASDV
jgi:hypothetical protein